MTAPTLFPDADAGDAWALWFRRGRGDRWRVVGHAATDAACTGVMFDLIADGHPSGDWLSLPRGQNANGNAARKSA